MIRFNHFGFTYPGASRPALVDVTSVLGPGELGLVMGLTGAGKTTLLKAVTGLVPHFSGGEMRGSVTVAGKDTSRTTPRQLAGQVGYVGQDPVAGFVTDLVEDELAYSMEQQGLDRPVMRTRVEEVIDLLGLNDLRQRPIATLSAGQAGRVAMAAALTTHPEVLVLDEPTSALDPAAAEEVMAAISRLVHDLDMTVLMAEHRLERVVQFADIGLYIDLEGRVISGDVRSVLSLSAVAPPVVQLGRRLGWPSTPLTVREARRLVTADYAKAQSRDKKVAGPVVLCAKDVTVTYPGGLKAVDSVSVTLRGGEITALMGRNGSGKTSLLWALQGHGPPGALKTDQTKRRHRPPDQPRTKVALVPASPTDLFWANTVEAELGSPAAGALWSKLAPEVPPKAHPRDLSEGQRLKLALAIQLSAECPVVALDEPTRGLDYQAKDNLAALLHNLANQGQAVLVASHDVEFLALVAARVIWLAGGQVIAEGPAARLLTSVPAHAPQMAKVFAPAPVLTVDQAVARQVGSDAPR